MSKPRLIAFYLPQFYPTPENDQWWGKGFTEWTNVGRAKPLFRGHYQPKVPADLGYYDLRVPETRILQANMAKNAGIEGFCYWHYWFGNGARLLDRVFREVVESAQPDFPFCLCWANHSWYAKTWDPDKPNKLLIEQKYPGEEDYKNHFYTMLPAFKDKRYIKIEGKLLFGIYAPLDFKDVTNFINIWNHLAKENGFKGFYFVGYTFIKEQIENIKGKGFDSVTVDYIQDALYKKNALENFKSHFMRHFFHKPIRSLYSTYCKRTKELYSCSNYVHPCIIPNFDHSPRSKHHGTILYNSTPELWGELCSSVFEKIKNREHDRNLVFIKAWNEWGEGNYLEPDLKYGTKYLENLLNAYNNV